MDVQGVNEVIDIKDPAADIENLQHNRKERDTAKHHVGQIADERFDKQLEVSPVFANLLFSASFYPALERR